MLPTQAPERQRARRRNLEATQRQRQLGRLVIALLLMALLALAAFWLIGRLNEPTVGEKGALPDTSDYHALLIDPSDPSAMLLGTHQGLHKSSDGGKTWSAANLEGDIMHLVVGGPDVIFAAGHEVLARSDDAGETWTALEPRGLPTLDIHGFAVDPEQPDTVYAAVASQGLFRSQDGARTFRKLEDAGQTASSLGVASTDPDRLYMTIPEGLVVSTNGGRTFKLVRQGVTSFAVNPSNPDQLLAAAERTLYLSPDGEKFEEVDQVSEGYGPLAFAPSNASRAYAAGYDGRLHVSTDGGKSWGTL